jgi:hypothetical protein
VNNRLGSLAANLYGLTLAGGELVLAGNSSASTVESNRVVTLGSGQSTITVAPGAARHTRANNPGSCAAAR